MDQSIRKYTNKKVLITGGGGYLGSKLAEKIVHSGASCFLLDVAFNQLSESLAEKHRDIHLVKADITDREGILEICTVIRPDYIFHFAASIDRSRDFSIYEKLYRINVEGTVNLLEALKDVPYKAFCYAGSSEVYGTKNPVPFHEDQVPDPVSPYSLTKLMAEQLIRTHSCINNKPFTLFRIFLFWSPDMPETTFLPQLIGAIRRKEPFTMTKGRQKRDYLPVDDLVNTMCILAGKKGTDKEIINLCSGNSISILEIVRLVKKWSPEKPDISMTLPYRPNEIFDIRGSDQKLLRLIPGFEPGSIENELKIYLNE